MQRCQVQKIIVSLTIFLHLVRCNHKALESVFSFQMILHLILTPNKKTALFRMRSPDLRYASDQNLFIHTTLITCTVFQSFIAPKFYKSAYLLKIFGPLRMFLISFFGVSICLDFPPPCLFLIISNIFSFGLTVYTAFVDGMLHTFILLNLCHKKSTSKMPML